MRSALLSQKIYTPFAKTGSLKSLPGLCFELLSQQRDAWQQLRKGYESLKEVKERDVCCREFSVRLHYNPGRLQNTTAGADETAAREQSCFLCLDRLPEGQKGILWRGDYLILCNPRPIFPSHLTLSHLDHRRQAIAEHIGAFLQMVADFGSAWTLLYNGPRCGASAPDHLHFQAVPSGQMPLEEEIRDERRLRLMIRTDGVSLYRARDLGREVILLEGEDALAMESVLKGFLDALKRILPTEGEPMMNIAGFHEGGRWRLVIFPRRKHRPDAFFREGDARIVVSPGVIDMGGVLVTPVEKDFDRLDRAAVEAIYREVSLERKIVEQAIEAVV